MTAAPPGPPPTAPPPTYVIAPPPSEPHPALFPEAREARRPRRIFEDMGPPPLLMILATAAAVLVILVVLFGAASVLGPGWWFPRPRALLACPRPPVSAEVAPQFNDQQRQVRDLRRRAFRGDFFAQLELARRYEGQKAPDKNLQDPVEAAVWYTLALANPNGYAPTSARIEPGLFSRGISSLYDDCRRTEREVAYRAADRLLSQMSTEEHDRVRDRTTYVLSSQGSDGLRTLGRLHDAAFGPYGEPPDNPQAILARSPVGWPDAVRLFERNGVDAYMFDYLAMQTGDQGAYVLIQDLQRTPQWAGYADIAEARARKWVPPYEFYPPEAPESGVPHSDESGPEGEIDRISLYRIDELPFRHISEALAYLHIIPKPVDGERRIPSHDIETFQAMLGRPATGWLSPLEKVRAIQFAAVNGSSRAQLVLAVMYAQGVGVSPDYARAFHWFEEADRQGSPEAKFAIATYFSEGMAGVADQDKAEAVVHQLDAALSGFRPSVNRLRAMLERVSPGRRRGWIGYSRPELQTYPGEGDRFAGADRRPGDDDRATAGDRGEDNEDWSEASGDTRRARRADREAPAHPRGSGARSAVHDNERDVR